MNSAIHLSYNWSQKSIDSAVAHFAFVHVRPVANNCSFVAAFVTNDLTNFHDCAINITSSTHP